MLNSRLHKVAARLKELIDEGKLLSRNCQPVPMSPGIIRSSYDPTNHSTVDVHAWVVKSQHILKSIFGISSSHAVHFGLCTEEYAWRRHNIDCGTGCLQAALSDLEGGFLKGQEIAIASEVFDTVLEQARYLNEKGFKDPAAVLMRVVLEDALKRIAREESIDNSQKATKINEDLWKADRYTQPQWRLIGAWLDTGNKAAHGDFSQYTQEDVKNAIQGVETFLAANFT